MKRTVTLVLGTVFVLAATAGAYAQAPQGQGRQGGRGRGPAAPACSTLQCDMLAEWNRNAQLMIGLVGAMPDDKFDYKPTPAQQTFAERVMHVVQIDQMLLGTLGAKTPPPAIDTSARSKAALLEALKQSFAWGEAVIKEFNDQQLLERITPPPFLGPSASRVRVMAFDMQHTQDTYGQLVVYLRLNGVTPPASNRGV